MKGLFLTTLLSLLTLLPTLAQVRTVPAFHAIKVSNGIELELTAGHPQRVEVTTLPTALADDLKTTVDDGVLNIRFEHPGGNVQSQRLRVAVTADQLTALTVSGGSAVTAHGDFAARTFALALSAGSAVRADMRAAALTVTQGGGSTLTLSGQADKLTLDVSGGSIFTGSNLPVATCQVQAGGGSVVRLNVKNSLVATASGGAAIKYEGAPQVVKSENSSGVIKAI